MLASSPFGSFGPGPGWDEIAGSRLSCTRRPLGQRAELLSLTGDMARENILIVPPVSGHSAMLLADLALGLSRHLHVHLIDQREPCELPSGLGSGCFQDHVGQIELAARSIGPLHLIGACQSTAATAEAAGRICGADREMLRSLSLLASPLSAQPGSGGVADQIPSEEPQSTEFLAQVAALTHSCRNGQFVLPGDNQLAAILQGSGGAARLLLGEHFASWDFTASSARRERARRRVRTLMSTRGLERGLLLESLLRNFISRPHARSRNPLRVDGPVLLVAGEDDRVIPPIQCHAGADYFSDRAVEVHTVPGADHFDLFCGEGAFHLGERLASRLKEGT